ncbi:glycosyltransferase [Metabacillus litoralis]|uniref:glycosyltransferase n=1 Tax=Metabacillus litoralis TaxID=152268 RepID=UPI001CFDF89D|nr:glycosyltransferase [Metabacillus litoralis]
MVSVVACTIRDSMMDNIFSNFNRQLWQKKELIIILNKDKMNKQKWEEKASTFDNVSIYQLPEEKTLGDCLNFGTEKAKYEIVAKLDDDDYYSEYYLTEAMMAFASTNAQLIGKGKSFMYFEKQKLLTIRRLGNENQRVKTNVKGGLKGGTLMFKKEIYPEIKFPSKVGSGTDSSFVGLCKRKKLRIYSTSRYNYVYIRKSNSDSHTYKRSNKVLLQKSRRVGKISNFVPKVTKAFGSNQ